MAFQRFMRLQPMRLARAADVAETEVFALV